jgi:ABC-type xylose transport system permease subunit
MSRKSRVDLQIEKTENLVNYLLKKKKENIQNSLIRPLHQEALKSLFFVAVLLLDTLLPLEAYRSIPSPFNIFIAIVLLGVFIYLEIRVYNALWGKKGRWSLEKYRTLIATKPEEKTEKN